MIKDQNTAEKILEIINTLLEASDKMKMLIEQGEYNVFRQLGENAFLLVKRIMDVADGLKEEEDGLNLPAASKSVQVSLVRILECAKSDYKKAVKKIEFELIPLIEEMRINFFFWGMVYPDKERMKKYYEEDIHLLGSNRYTTEGMKTGAYKYDLTIYVIGYNEIEYTTICLENLYKNLPTELKYEIILVNHGSSDETQQLFESYNPDKQIDIAINGGGLMSILRVAEGKYILGISNDVVVTKNAIDNMYKCISSDEKIVWAVPSTPNTPNMQSLPITYETFDEMHKFVEVNNNLDKYRWEQRARLCDPIAMQRMDFNEKTKRAYLFHAKNIMSFPDDMLSLVCRRNGYKMYLVKDAYCHHFGSITLKSDEQTNSREAFERGRKHFKDFFGIDPWIPSICYSRELISKLPCNNKDKVKILGIDCGVGSNPLKIKEQIKENEHNENCYIKNVLSVDKYYLDAKSLSDEVVVITSDDDILNMSDKYDYIVNERMVDADETFWQQLDICRKIAKKSGVIVLYSSKELEAFTNRCSKLYEEFKTVQTAINPRGALYPAGSIWVILSNN